MTTVQISLNSITKVKTFIQVVNDLPGDFDLSYERYVVDAKSIMGVFSLDLGKTLTLNISDTQNLDSILASLQPFIVC